MQSIEVNRCAPLIKLMSSHGNMNDLRASQTWLLVDGELVGFDDTPAKLGLENEDVIVASLEPTEESARAEARPLQATAQRRARRRQSLESYIAKDLQEDPRPIRRGGLIKAFGGWKR